MIHATRRKRLMILGAVAALAVAYILTCIPNIRRAQERQRVVRQLQAITRDRVESAVQAFVRDRKATNGIVPDTVSMRELVSSAYLRIEGVNNVAGSAFAFDTRTGEPEGEAVDPTAVLVEVRFADGPTLLLMADGSVQGLTQDRLKRLMEQQSKPGSHPGRAANENQPVRSETNSTSAAAGTRR